MTRQLTIMATLADELQAVVSALVGGARYGVKIRLPHALVMTVLFRNDLTSKQKIRSVLKLAIEHASNLAAFASIYKIILAKLKWSSRYLREHQANEKTLGKMFLRLIVDGPLSDQIYDLPAPIAGYPERPYHALIAGATGGYMIWGRYSSVNHQIILYLTSRVLVGLAKRFWEKLHGSTHHHSPILHHTTTYKLLAAMVWGSVMVLFEESPHVLHRSLKQSMDEIYRFQLPSLLHTIPKDQSMD